MTHERIQPTATLAAFLMLCAAAPVAGTPVGAGRQEPSTPAPRFAILPDTGNPLVGITRVRPVLAFSAPEAEACQVAAADIDPVMRTRLSQAGLVLVSSENLTLAAAAAAPEFNVSITVLRDETGICTASLWVQLGAISSAVLVHRNVDTAPGSLVLSNVFVELARTAQLSVGVPPTFGDQLKAAVREQIDQIANEIRSANGASTATDPAK